MAIYDLVEENSFGVPGRDDGPYSMRSRRRIPSWRSTCGRPKGETALSFGFSMTPFRLVAEGLFSGLRDLLLRDPDGEPAPDRGYRPRTGPSCTTRAPTCRATPRGQGRRSTRHRAPSFHAGVDLALEDMSARPRAAGLRHRQHAACRAAAGSGNPAEACRPRPCRSGRRPRKNSARSACRRPSGPSPGRAVRPSRVSFSIIPIRARQARARLRLRFGPCRDRRGAGRSGGDGSLGHRRFRASPR